MTSRKLSRRGAVGSYSRTPGATDITGRTLREYMTTCPEPLDQTDEYYCSRCYLRWDKHEERPACPKQAK